MHIFTDRTFNTVSSLSTLSLHLHPESLLPLSGGHPGSPLQHGHWHVEPGLHPCRTLHRLSPLPGGEWSGANRLHHGGVLNKYLPVHTCCTVVLSQLSLHSFDLMLWFAGSRDASQWFRSVGIKEETVFWWGIQHHISFSTCLLRCYVTNQIYLMSDSKGNPRNITNSKGKKRTPNSKDLSTALKTTDPLFLDFIKRCLAYVERA